MSQKALAGKLGVDQSTLAAWEQGRHRPSRKLWARVTDAGAERLHEPLAALSLEMIYSGPYYLTQAYHRGEASDPLAYLAYNATWLGVPKGQRKYRPSPLALFSLTNLPGP